MPCNIEIKARVADRAALERIVAGLADSGPEILEQDDTFFAVPAGRLKLREFAEGASELIFYHRSDTAGPKPSHYRIAPLPAAEPLRGMLADALGNAGRVRKRRTLYLVGPTRIHLDQVEGLGDFMELEVVLNENQSPAEGTAIADQLLQQLEIPASALIRTAYVDLLSQSTGPGR